MMWLLILAGLGIMGLASIGYLALKPDRFPKVRRLLDKVLGKETWKHVLAGLLLVLVFSGALILILNMMNAIIILLHLLLIWILCDLADWIIRKVKNKGQKNIEEQEAPKEERPYIAGMVALVLTAVYLSYGWFCAHHVFVTNYAVQTAKDLGTDSENGKEDLHIVWFSDSHVGATFTAETFRDYCDDISAEMPDLVIVAGDFVDDDTTKEDMIASCEALGSIQTRYGIYYAFGNHDKGYYDRSYSGKDLEAELEKNGVCVLEDEVVLVDGRFYVIGRADAQVSDRLSMEELTRDLKKDLYQIVIDHQPTDYEKEAEAKVDLVLSGHTHGGQMIPITKVGEILNINDRTYGWEERGDTQFIVSSGIGDWTLKFKTGCISEYVIVDVEMGK